MENHLLKYSEKINLSVEVVLLANAWGFWQSKYKTVFDGEILKCLHLKGIIKYKAGRQNLLRHVFAHI